jgi:hypothetical protein
MLYRERQEGVVHRLQAARIAAAITALLACGGVADAQDRNVDAPAPGGEAPIVYIQFRFLSQQLVPGTFAASPRKVWRSGTRYMRVEEEPDLQQGIAGTTIVNEPDLWMWNRLTGAARHVVDHGAPYEAHIALFPDEPAPMLKLLEFGREKAFFAKNGGDQGADAVVDHVECSVQSLIAGDSLVTLYLRKSTGLPFQISISNPRHAYSVRYEIYEPAFPFDAALFAPPPNIKIEEAK